MIKLRKDVFKMQIYNYFYSSLLPYDLFEACSHTAYFILYRCVLLINWCSPADGHLIALIIE